MGLFSSGNCCCGDRGLFSDALEMATAVLGLLIGDFVMVGDKGLEDFLSHVRDRVAIGNGAGVVSVFGDFGECLPEKLMTARRDLNRVSIFFPSFGLPVEVFVLVLTSSMCLGPSMEVLGDETAVVGVGGEDNAVVGVGGAGSCL